MDITSSSNNRIKELQKLIKSSKEREERGLYVVEGIRMVREIDKPNISEIYISESAIDKFSEYIECSMYETYTVADNVFSSVSDTKTPQGILAVVRIHNNEIEDIINENSLIMILERIQDPGNMGTIIRTSEGAGVSGLLISSDCVDVYSPKVIRSTMGAIFRMPIFVSSDLLSDIEYLKSKGIKIYAGHLKGRLVYSKNYCEPTAFMIGNEGNGLSEEVSKQADELIKIPMYGKLESLNAAVSATVLMYEALRQREIL